MLIVMDSVMCHTNPSGIKISIIPPGKEPQKTNVLAEGRGNFEGMV